ncbi:MAG: SUMF1/EgtB/PvdO family nonheme iron enzyme [Bacteroidia bacterium]|nr:SUMF1/EgtB/PvdO family nonheme iron enzyme [Bacteroidia bacterium]
MKITLFAFLFLVISNLNAQKNDLIFTYKSINKNYVKVDSMLYCNVYETTNVEYRDFLSELKQSGKIEEYKVALPDTNGWKSKNAYNEPYVELYFRHPAYQNYPLVNVSYDQAIKYCDWLTQKYNSQAKRKFKKVVFRLPNKTEWENAAHGGLKENVYPWGGYYLVNNKGGKACNYLSIGDEGITFDTINKKFILVNSILSNKPVSLKEIEALTMPAMYYEPNGFGVYNIAGNASEMIKEKGIAKGGSWISPGYDVRIESEEFYSHSSNHMGFRVFMQVLEQ